MTSFCWQFKIISLWLCRDLWRSGAKNNIFERYSLFYEVFRRLLANHKHLRKTKYIAFHEILRAFRWYRFSWKNVPFSCSEIDHNEALPFIKQGNERTDTQTHRRTDTQTDRHTDRQTHKHKKRDAFWGYYFNFFHP